MSDPVEHPNTALEIERIHLGHPDDARFYLARSGDQGVGALHLEMGDDTALVEHIYVVPQHRHRGVGAELVEAARRDTGLLLVHDGRTSDAGEAFARAQGVLALYAERDPLDAAVVEETGAKLLRTLLGTPDPHYTDKPGALPELVADNHVALSLKITNRYELYPTVITYVVAVVPRFDRTRESDEAVQARSDWEWDHIHALTGVGHSDGDSWHDVEVLGSSDPDLIPVGIEYEFGY